MTLKAKINAALANRSGIQITPKLVFVDGLFYDVRSGSSPFVRAKAQKELRKRYVDKLPAAPPVVKNSAPVGSRIVVGPGTNNFGKRAATLDFIRFARRFAPAPALKIG